ncbi:MAG TPA: ribosome maturation factor RimP [Tissierellaceae bacterium]|nr:ribosome maturation factor RimP [Tissierellaceae bacterium]
MSRNLSREEIIYIVSDIGKPMVEELGYELVDVEYTKESGDFYLRIYIYRDEGIDLEDCQKISRILSDKLDEIDPIPGAYYLEISSPGLDRPLKTDSDLKRNLKKEIEIRLYRPINNQKVYEGILEDFNNDCIVISNNKNGTTDIPRELISLIKLVIKF